MFNIKELRILNIKIMHLRTVIQHNVNTEVDASRQKVLLFLICKRLNVVDIEVT